MEGDSEDIVEMESVHSGDLSAEDDSSAIVGRVEQLVYEFGRRGKTSDAGKRLRDESDKNAARAGGGSKRRSILWVDITLPRTSDCPRSGQCVSRH